MRRPALQVDVIMQGTVRRLGEHFRITIELSDRQGILAWSDRFDAPPDQVHELPERIARTVLSRVRVDHCQLRAGAQGVGPTALASNAQVFRARQLLDLQTPAALHEAQALFQQVAREAPDYARGHSGFADALLDQFRLGLIDRATVTAAGTAVEAARKAVGLPGALPAASLLNSQSAPVPSGPFGRRHRDPRRPPPHDGPRRYQSCPQGSAPATAEHRHYSASEAEVCPTARAGDSSRPLAARDWAPPATPLAADSGTAPYSFLTAGDAALVEALVCRRTSTVSPAAPGVPANDCTAAVPGKPVHPCGAMGCR